MSLLEKYEALTSFNPDETTTFLNSQSDEVARHITDDLLKIADEITIKDLLSSHTCRCETISLIQNLYKYCRYYQTEDQYEVELFDDLRQVYDHLPRQASKTAFETIYKLKQMTDKGRVHLPMRCTTRTAPSRIAAKPTVNPLSDEQISNFVETWVNLLRKESKRSFSRAELLDWIQKAYLKVDKFSWHPNDLETAGREESWKNRVSARLQELQTQEVLNFRSSKQLWYIYED